jgi:hypothetical protein
MLESSVFNLIELYIIYAKRFSAVSNQFVWPRPYRGSWRAKRVPLPNPGQFEKNNTGEKSKYTKYYYQKIFLLWEQIIINTKNA